MKQKFKKKIFSILNAIFIFSLILKIQHFFKILLISDLMKVFGFLFLIKENFQIKKYY